MGFHHFYLIQLAFTGFEGISMGFTGFNLVLLNLN